MAARPINPEASARPSQREALNYLVLSLLAALPYANTLINGFVYDDRFQVVENPYVHSFHYLRQIFGSTVWSFQGAQPTNYYRPLMSLAYLLCYQVAGLVPFTFHLLNIILQVAIVLLVFAILRRLSGERIAFVAAGLFALHPIHTETVSWIAGITDLELSVFYLLAFLLYLRIFDPPRPRTRQWPLRAAMCVSLALALLSKEQAVTLPALATIFEYFYRDDRAETTGRQKFARFGPLWAVTALYLVVRTSLLGGIAGVVMRSRLSWYEVALSSISLTGSYFGKLLWPVHLSAFYVFHKSGHLFDRGVVLGVVVLALCVLLFAALWRRAHAVSFAFVLMFITLGPVLNVRWMAAAVFAERYLYMPSIGFCWLIAWAAVTLWSADTSGMVRALSRTVPALLAVVALLYAVKTVSRNRDWRSEDALFAQTLREQPDSTLILADVGMLDFGKGDFAGAEHEWLEALSVGPENVFALDNLALLRQRQHRYLESLDYSWRALRARPAYTMGHLNLAETLAKMGSKQEAEWQFRIATALSPLSTRAHNKYGKFLFEADRLDDARAQYERSAQIDSTSEAYDRLGDIYLVWKDFPRSGQGYRHAIALDPFDSHAHVGLGQVLESLARPTDALQEYETGLQTDPNDLIAKSAVLRLRGAASERSITR